MIPKKRPVSNEQNRDNSLPFRVGKSPVTDSDSPSSRHDVSTAKVRLSADIDHATYIKIKLYSATKRKSIVSLVTGWIDTYCTL